MQKRILVIGGTGTLGHPVSRCLKASGFVVRIITRDHQKAKTMFDDSFELLAGDPTQSRCLEEALDDCYGVHISLPPEVEQQVTEATVKSASTHSVERISYISGATVAPQNRWFPMINRKFLAERAVREGGIPYAIFCPTWVMEILPKFVVQGRAAVFGTQPCPYHWVAADDLAMMVAAFYELDKEVNKRFLVFGPEAISMQEALNRYCAIFHPDIKKVSTMPLWLVKILAKIMGNHELASAGELMSYFERVGEGSDPIIDNSVLGAPATTLNMWLENKRSKGR